MNPLTRRVLVLSTVRVPVRRRAVVLGVGVVALVSSAGPAHAQTTVMTDAYGKFRAVFVVGPNTPLGHYLTIAEPTITPDMILSVWGGTFVIE